MTSRGTARLLCRSWTLLSLSPPGSLSRIVKRLDFLRPLEPAVEFVVFLFPMNDSIGSTLRSRSISARRVARAPNGRTLESAYHPETYARARSCWREPHRNSADRGERDERNLQLTSLITSCPHVVALLNSASRVRSATTLKLFNCTARYFPTTEGSRTFFVLDVRRSNGLNRLTLDCRDK